MVLGFVDGLYQTRVEDHVRVVAVRSTQTMSVPNKPYGFCGR